MINIKYQNEGGDDMTKETVKIKRQKTVTKAVRGMVMDIVQEIASESVYFKNDKELSTYVDKKTTSIMKGYK